MNLLRTGSLFRFKRKLIEAKAPSNQIFSTNGREYDVNKLFELAKDIPEEEVDLADYVDQLKDYVWTEGDSEKKIRPIDIDESSEHWQRMLDADLDYPILIGPNNEIMDGYHRLARAFFLRKPKIKIQKFDHWPREALIREE